MRIRSRHGRAKGFTLLELLVVIGIIALASAMAMPAINKFLKGQKLNQSGRLVQAAFNDARRGAITQRAEHYVFFGHKAGDATGANDVFSLKVYRKLKGWEPNEVVLPSGVLPVFEDGDTVSWNTQKIWGCKMQVQDWANGPPADTAPADPSGRAFASPTKTILPACNVFEFRKDGTINRIGGVVKVPAAVFISPPLGTDIYDTNQILSWVSMGAIGPTTGIADIVLRQVGDPNKRCFIDIDLNTGRVRYRVADNQPAGAGTSSGNGGYQ